jgi:hypothetical protein
VRQCRLLARSVPGNETRDRHKCELPDHDARLPVHIWIAISEEFATECGHPEPASWKSALRHDAMGDYRERTVTGSRNLARGDGVSRGA